ncbi:MAG: hypothetical protein HQK88_09585 [Nitrospirae bacterium]|nr:hypothetical protein [Nitrospirota bacterium]MBF0534162.1 hypothetical protein [Nitrospirota bacterium]MBF0617049.1 hypothetical protein [Nitrospirota bacterium]
MGLFKAFSGKSENSKNVPQQPIVKEKLLNNRRSIRYLVEDVPIGETGVLVNIGRGGCKLKKLSPDLIDMPEIKVTIAGKEYRSRVVWQDDKHIGLELQGGFESSEFIIKYLKKVRDISIRPLRRLSDEAIKGFVEKDMLGIMVNLMAELEAPNCDMSRMKLFVCKLSGLKEAVAEKANIIRTEEEVVTLKDVDYAIKRLGTDTVKKVSLEYIKKKSSEIEVPEWGAHFYDSYKILKTVFFSKLAPFFGYKDNQNLAEAILNLETKGVDIFLNKGNKNFMKFYNSPTKIYSELTRFLEKINFGKDLIQVNKIYITSVRKPTTALYDGYVLAHLARYPHITLDKSMKLSLNKIVLNFSLICNLTILATEAFIEKDKYANSVLVHKLKRTGMDENKLLLFLDNIVNETNKIMNDIGKRGNLKGINISGTPIRIREFLAKEPNTDRFLNSFKEFKDKKRLVIKYEDDTYTHYILGRILDSEEFELNTKLCCILPCECLLSEDFSVEQFSYFNVVVFKNIDQLSPSLLRSLVKMWNTFEGSIILTFSAYSMLDYSNKELFLLLRKYIVDFPSYFADQKIYIKMVEHVTSYIKNCTNGGAPDDSLYTNNVITMDHIRGSALLQAAQSLEEEEESKP